MIDDRPSLSTLRMSLLSFWAIHTLPSSTPRMPSALLPLPCHHIFQRWPAAMPPGMGLTVYSRAIGLREAACPGVPAAPPPAPAAPAARGGGGGRLQVA